MNPELFLDWLHTEVERLSQESMQVRAQMEASLQQYNLKLGEYNGQMKALEALEERIKAGEWDEGKDES